MGSGVSWRVGFGLGQLAGARALAGLRDARGQSGVADQLLRRREAPDVADTDGDRQPEQVADAGDRDQQADAPIDGSAAR